MKIILYSTGCPRCSVLKRKLDEKCVAYEENHDENEMIRHGITEVPVLSVDGRLMNYRTAVTWINEY